jgi:hypothetical protein
MTRVRTSTRVCAVALLLAVASLAAGQSVSAPALTAGFLYNFAKFAEWPDSAPAGAVTLCVLGDTAVAEALDVIVRGRTIDGREIAVVHAKADALRACHVLYVSGLDQRRSQQIVDELRTAPVMTVSDRDRFAESGGIAGFYVEAGKMRFTINLDAALRARLRISSRLLNLAKLVKDDHVQP